LFVSFPGPKLVVTLAVGLALLTPTGASLATQSCTKNVPCPNRRAKPRHNFAHAPAPPTQASDLAQRAKSDRCTEQARQKALTGDAWENFLVRCLRR
jgi:hypothetical protein